MASITTLGVGSGLDLNTIVTQLVALERQPIQALQARANTMNSQISLFGRINSLFSSMQTAANKLTDTTVWQRTVASSGDTTSVAVSSGSGAAAGSYAVTVQALAGNQTVASDVALPAATDLVGAGRMTLQLGTWDAGMTTLTDKPDSPSVDIDISATDTLETLRDKINSANAGVTASLVTDANGVRLALRAKESGAVNGFRLSVDDIDGALIDGIGLSRFAFDPAVTTSGLVLKQSASNAQALVNGIAVESATNDITGAVDGLTLSLRKITAAPVNVSVNRDRDAVIAGVKSFVEAYNGVVAFLAEQTKYDAASKSGGPLQGDAVANGLTTQLRGILNSASGASSIYARLSDLGLQSQRDGTLTINQTKLDNAVDKNPEELRKVFANSDTDGIDPDNNGFARRFAALAGKVLAVDGTVNTRTQSLQKQISKNSAEQDRISDRADLFQKRLIAQYTALDSNVAKLNALQSYVTQQIAQMNRSTSN